MKLTFIVEYFTNYGENLEIVLSNDDAFEVLPMHYEANGKWQISVDNQSKFNNYYYQLASGGVAKKEWGTRIFPIAIKEKNLIIFDEWHKANFPENYLGSNLFKKHRKLNKTKQMAVFTHQLSIHAPLFEDHQTLCVIGNVPALGGWQFDQAVVMSELENGVFEVNLNIKDTSKNIEYKYGVYDLVNKKVAFLEVGNNRLLIANESTDQVFVKHDVYFKYQDFQLPKIKGIAVPVFSLNSKNGLGIGEFTDLKNLGDWAAAIGLNLIQVLPINDTLANLKWTDSYPYAAISVYALNPVYINIQSLPYALDKKIAKQIIDAQKAMNNNDFIDLEQVIETKFSLLRAIFDLHQATLLADKKFLNFIETNESWLKPYAAFCALRDENKTVDFSQWKTLKSYDEKKVNAFFEAKSKYYNAVHFYAFIQYHLDQQLVESIDYLHSLNIKVKGDLPIGIYRHSVEAWKEPELFGMDFQAGAPPDDFAVLGQNWEFPTYNWERMKADDYKWWKNRFKALEKYFDAMRIDHILGFFRIWRMDAKHTQGIMGYFYPAVPVTRAEFDSRGIPFYEEAFCEPFITRDIINEVFGYDALDAYNTYFDESYGKITFKEAYNSQRKIEHALNGKVENHIKDKLLYLASNVLFLKEERDGTTVYHPRFNLRNTHTYRYLSQPIQHKIDALYVDYLFKRQESLWHASAMEKLPVLLQSTDMLICGEDLGFVPKCVPSVMDELAILSLQVQRMPNTDIAYHNPYNAPYLSVVTPATHDTSTIRQWWEEDHEFTKKYYYNQLGGQGLCPYSIEPQIMYDIIKQHMDSPAMFSVIPLQEWLFLNPQTTRENKDDERINVPAIFPHYWRYRMQVKLEDLLSNQALNETIRSLTK
jgi:4-alpha-glucanotransferase